MQIHKYKAVFVHLYLCDLGGEEETEVGALTGFSTNTCSGQLGV